MPEINPYEPSSIPVSNEPTTNKPPKKERNPWLMLLLTPFLVLSVAYFSAIPAILLTVWTPKTPPILVSISAMLSLSIFFIPTLGTFVFMCRWTFKTWQKQREGRIIKNKSWTDANVQQF